MSGNLGAICSCVNELKYAQKLQESIKLNKEITELNLSLDQKIIERTRELERANAQLEVLTTQDALTEIANRYLFDENLKW